jgi:hypothetical protein
MLVAEEVWSANEMKHPGVSISTCPSSDEIVWVSREERYTCARTSWSNVLLGVFNGFISIEQFCLCQHTIESGQLVSNEIKSYIYGDFNCARIC